jgi:hypothetical protein
MFHLQSSETLKNLTPELLQEIKELSRKSIGGMARIFKQGVEAGNFIDMHPVALSDIFWSLFSGVVLWTNSKRIINADKDFLRETLDLAFSIFKSGVIRT